MTTSFVYANVWAYRPLYAHAFESRDWSGLASDEVMRKVGRLNILSGWSYQKCRITIPLFMKLGASNSITSQDRPKSIITSI